MWRCLKCGEEHEESFAACWHCGSSKDGIEDPAFRNADEIDVASIEPPARTEPVKFDQAQIAEFQKTKLVFFLVFTIAIIVAGLGLEAYGAKRDFETQGLAKPFSISWACLALASLLYFIAAFTSLIVGSASKSMSMQGSALIVFAFCAIWMLFRWGSVFVTILSF